MLAGGEGGHALSIYKNLDTEGKVKKSLKQMKMKKKEVEKNIRCSGSFLWAKLPNWLEILDRILEQDKLLPGNGLPGVVLVNQVKDFLWEGLVVHFHVVTR